MRLKEYSYDDDQTNTQQTDNPMYKKPSKWTPSPGRDQALDCYINAVERAILQRTHNNKLRSNITRRERAAIKTLKRDKNIAIFQADKGAAVVIQNRKDYLSEAYKQLNGTDENGKEVYLHVPNDPTADFIIRVKEAVREAHSKRVINADTADFLIMENARPGNIYFVPKITNHNVHLQLDLSAILSTPPQLTSPSGLTTNPSPCRASTFPSQRRQ